MLHGSLDGRGVWGRMDTCMCMAESLCCPPETITTLLISYTMIQNKKVFFFFFKKRAVAKSCPKLPAEPANQKAFQSSNEYLSGVHHMPGTAPNATNTKVNNIAPALMEF